MRKVLRIARAGAVRSVVRMPRTLTPGVYTFSYVGRGDAGARVERSSPLTLPGPPEGVVRRASISRIRGGPPAARLPRTTTRLWARFEFAARPQGRRITVWWARNGRRATPFEVSGYRRVFDDFTGNYARLLPGGRWTCVLQVDGRIVRRVSVLVR